MIVVVVDADGRIAPAAPPFVAAHFVDPEVGGVQALVRIYNRGGFLTHMQDVEFGVYGSVYQAGTNREGTAGMGGNGQFNRLAALDAIVEGARAVAQPADRGPGPRAAPARGGLEIAPGAARAWSSSRASRACDRCCVSARAGRRATCRRSVCSARAGARHSRRGARLEEALYLLMPLWQASWAWDSSPRSCSSATGSRRLVPSAETIPLVYVLGFSNGVLGCFAARQATGWRSWLRALAVAHLYALYTWILFPVIARAFARQLSTRRDWSRTEREPISGTAANRG